MFDFAALKRLDKPVILDTCNPLLMDSLCFLVRSGQLCHGSVSVGYDRSKFFLLEEPGRVHLYVNHDCKFIHQLSFI